MKSSLSGALCAAGLVMSITTLGMAQVPVEGFLPLVGLALTDEFENSKGASATFFVAEPSDSPGGSFLGQGSSTYYDVALLDTGAATHILTNAGSLGFDILGEGFGGTNFQTIGGATGLIDLRVDDPLGVYVTGLEHTTSGAGQPLTLDDGSLRGQTSFALLSAPVEWQLPNIIGLPMAAQHKVHIRNSSPQIKNVGGRTIRTPEIDFSELGSGNEGILRRTAMTLTPGLSFVQGPLYQFGFDIFGGLDLHDNPTSPSVIPNSAFFVDTDLSNDGNVLQDRALFFDTGASLTVLSEQTAARLGIDPILDTPDFEIVVEGSGGVSAGIPGFFIDELNLDTVGGSFTLTNVPIAVLDVTNPADPGNVVAGILGMNLFVGRDLVIDANPSIGQGGVGPSVYISDPVTTDHSWGTVISSGDWEAAGNWTAAGIPDTLWVAKVANVSGSHQEAVLSSESTVFRAVVSGTPGAAEMDLRITSTGTLTLFADLEIHNGGRVHLEDGGIDAQFVQMEGGALSGSGTIFVGSGPINAAVRNEGGVISPGDTEGNPIGTISISGDLGLGAGGTVAIDLGGTTAATEYDQLDTSRFAFLAGTLQVSLVDLGGGLFMPEVGDIFRLISAGDSIQGTFETLDLPAGFAWDVNYTSTAVELSLLAATLVGDYDGSGEVDGNDLNLVLFEWNKDGDDVVVGWINQRPQSGTVVGIDHLNLVLFNWGSMTSATAAVPEPTGFLPILLGLLAAVGMRRQS